MPSDSDLRAMLARSVRIAVIGAKDVPGSPVDRVGRFLLNAGFDVMPVHPVRRHAWGLPCAHSIAELPERGFSPDVVCLFRASRYCPDHAREVLGLPVPPALFWMQEGIRSPEAAEILAGSGVDVVEDRCLKTTLGDLFPDRTKTFSCKRCGKCCEGRGGIVVGPRDLPRLCAHFGVPAGEFLETYTEAIGGKPVIRTGSDGFCMFFRKGTGCGIHPARPAVCRAWPFFRGNLVDEISFAMAREDCPGISRTASHAEFAHEGFRYLQEFRLRASDVNREGRAVIVEEDELPALRPQASTTKEER